MAASCYSSGTSCAGEVIANAQTQDALDAGLDPRALQARVTSIIQGRTGL